MQPDIRVMIRNKAGRYLAWDIGGLSFTEDRTRAAIFDLDGDQVEEQLRRIRENEGIVLVTEPVPMEEIYEKCDRCRDFFPPFMIVFDGTKFLCADCRSVRIPRRRTV